MHSFELLTRLVAFFTLFASVIGAPVPDGDEDATAFPPKDKVYIKGIQYAGSGCPAGSVAGGPATGDWDVFSILFDQYVASIGPNEPVTNTRKNCQLKIDLVYPKGWSYSLYETEYRGFVDVQKGVSAIQQSDYYFPGQSGTATFRSQWYGAFTENYVFTDTIGDSQVIWSPCGKVNSLNINTSIRLTKSSDKKYKDATGMITTDSITHKVVHKYFIKWRWCGP